MHTIGKITELLKRQYPSATPLASAMEQSEEAAEGLQEPQLDVAELQSQFDFEQQQSQLAHLRDTLQRTQQTLSTTEKEKENYVATLSRIRMQRRSKGGQRKRDEPGEVEGASTSFAESPKAADKAKVQDVLKTPEGQKLRDKTRTPGSSGRVNLLKQGLEESRQIMEQRVRITKENQQSIAGMAEQLKVQLSETEGVAAEKSDEPAPEPLPSIDSMSDHKSREMYAQILYKDNKIIELNNRILELERNIMDYQENLREKDSVLDAKARSITLISEDMSRRNKTNVDALEETRKEMREMQNQFVELEAKLRSENQALSTSVAAKDQRLSQLEALRFELNTRNAELQQKVVVMQTRSHEVLSQGLPADKERIEELSQQLSELSSAGRAEDQAKIEELSQQLSDSTKLVTKTKAQYGKKIKSLEKQLNTLKKSESAEQELQSLQNRIAELEEEKGNLQLHLVDFDEMKASEWRLEGRVAELEERVQQQSSDLDSHVRALASVEADKLQLLQSVQQLQASESELQAELEAARAALLEHENATVESEMKAVELEERLDQLSAVRAELEEELAALRPIRAEEQALSVSLAESQASLEMTQLQLSEQLNTEKKTKAQLEEAMQSTTKKLTQLENELQVLKESLSTQEHSNISLQQEITNLQDELKKSQVINEEMTIQVSSLQDEVRINTESHADQALLSREREDGLKREFENVQMQLRGREEELAALRVTVEMQGALGEEVERWRAELQQRTQEVHTLTQQLEESKAQLSSLNDGSLRTKELEEKMAELSCNITELQSINSEQAETIHRTQQGITVKETEHEAEVESLEMELQKKQQRACDLEEQLSLALESQQEIQLQYETINQELIEVKKLRDESDVIVEKLSLKINQMEEQLIARLGEKQTLAEELEHLKQDKTKSSHALNMAQNTLRELQQEMEAKNAALLGAGEAEQRVAALQTELTQLQRKFQDEGVALRQRAEQAEDELSAAFSQSEHMAKEHRAAQEKWHQEQEALQTQLLELQELKETLEETIGNLQDNTTSLQVQLGVLMGEKESLESELSNLKERLVESNLQKEQNELYIQQISELQMELSCEQQSNITTVQALKDDNNNLKTQLQQSNNFVSQLQAQLSNEQHNISSHIYALQEEIRLLNDNKEVSAKHYFALQNQLHEVEVEQDLKINDLLVEKKALSEQLSHSNNNILELTTLVSNSEAALSASKQQIMSLQSEIDSLNHKVQDLVSVHEDMGTRKLDVTNLEGKLCSTQEENERLKAQLQQRENVQSEILSNNNELQATLNEREKSSKENLNHLNSELEACRNQIKKLENIITDYTRQIEEYEINKTRMNEYCQKLTNDLLESQNYNQMIQNVVGDLQNRMQAMQNAEVEQAENYMALTTQVKTSEEMNSNLQEEILELHRIMEEHPVWQESGDEVRELKLQLQASERERKRLMEQIETLVLKVQDERIKLEGTDMEQQAALQAEVEALNAEVGTMRRELEVAREEVARREHEVVGWEEQESWGDAAGLEEQHMQKQASQQQSAPDHLLVAALQAQLAEAESSQARLQEELRASQVRCGKLIKQVKNLKEQVSKKQAGSSDLDKVLEEELQSQLTSLQKELTEIHAEKTSLLARADTLVVANERLIDMKEQQDAELERSRAERASLMQKLNALEQWQPDDEGNSQRISELESQLRQARDKCVELEEAYETKLLQDQVDNKAPTQEIGIVTEPLAQEVMRTETAERATSPVPQTQEETVIRVEEMQMLRTQLEAKTRELKAREEEHHSLAAYIAQLRGAVEAKSQELAAYDERPEEAELRMELDSALYLLHQRDVRCDELTLELMALMEERDALQLRLSSALRLNEQQRASVTPEPSVIAQDTSRQQELHSKLSELRALGHTRDVALRGEREARHSEQRQILQPSRPSSEAGDAILESDHTLRKSASAVVRDSQSTSTVLFNWLWGRSTPRVQDM